MEKTTILLVLLISFVLMLSLYLLNLIGLTGMFIGFGTPQNAEWWNITYHYRFRLETNSTDYSRTDWPIEQEINFTDLLPSGTFDVNSIRVFEYSSPGIKLYEVPSQFEPSENFNSASNAVGILVFLMNGTTNANNNRTFYVYYDNVENGAKENPNYVNYTNYSWDGKLIHVNNSFLMFHIDTNRSENTSGFYTIEDYNENILLTATDSERTAEYSEYSNGTHNFTFDLIGNASFTNGSVRLIIEQRGDEIIFGNPSQKTNEGSIIKRYYIYNKAGSQSTGTFIKMWQRLSNVAGYNITRNSTPSGALSFDVNRTFLNKNIFSQDYSATNPYSWVWAEGGVSGANELVGIISLNQTGTSNYFATIATNYGRVGIQLNSTNISSSSYIEQSSLIYLAPTGGATAVSEFENVRDRVVNPLKITQYLPENLYVSVMPSTNETIYNRNETVLIIGNLTEGDPYNITEYMNATLDMGTVSASDDQTIILYDDGSHDDGGNNDKVFANSFQITNNAEIGTWTINLSSYTNTSEFFNSTNYTFNVTDMLNVTVYVINPSGLTERTVLANIYVKNYINVTWISEAIINCSYDSSEVTNKTDWLNGTYSINFTAPSVEGDFNLSCNVTKNNNTGSNNDSFVTEAAKVNVSIIAQPSNATISQITLYNNDSFVTTANATNLGNGSAYISNISLELLSGWDANVTVEQCGDISKSGFCTKAFNITVIKNTVPGVYYVNVTVNWTNPDGTLGTNKTALTVNVTSNPKINTSEDSLLGEAGDGINMHIFNFTVLSIGNDALQNIAFNCYSGTVCNDFTVNFTPTSISSLSVGSNYSVAVNVTVPLSYSVGSYTGIVNVSASNDGYKNLSLNVSTAPKTNVSMLLGPSSYSSGNITKLNNESFIFNSTFTNIGNGSARYANMSIFVPSNLTSNSTFEYCNNLTKYQTCFKAFNIIVLNGTAPGVYYVNVTVNWTNPDGTLGTNTSFLNVTVTSNPLINVSETIISQSVNDSTNTRIGNFTVLSIGNDALQNIAFSCYSGTVCNDFTVNFTPTSISSLSVGSNYSVAVNVTVPLSYSVGSYTGIVNVSASNDGYKNLSLNVSVNSNRTWTMNPTSCSRSESPDEGTVCEVLVRNLGNDIINFTISPEEANHSKVNVTNFYVNKTSNYTFSVTYNITGYSQAIYNSTFVIDANQSNSNPDNTTLNITLYPYLPPVINFSVTPIEAEQNSSIVIFANMTDTSNTGIKWVNISVKKPDGTTNQTNMTLVNMSGNFSQWNFTYPSSLGNTSLRGVYNVTIFAEDNIGNIGNSTRNFSIYTRLLITSATLTSTYLQGDTGSILYIAKNASGTPISGINLSFAIRNSNNNISYTSSGQTNYDGTIYPLPTFVLATDAPTGTYTLFSNSTYYDDVLNQSILTQKNSTFLVNARTVTVTGLFADIETAVAWYPTNIMRFGILVYNGEGRPVDPDAMNLTVYDPANNVYFITGISNMTKQATGYYTYSYAMGVGTSVGMYLAVLNVSQSTFSTMKLKAFRVSQGGPYDVRINLFENEVPQGDYLDFALIVENKGEVSQDVFVEYSIISGNSTYYTASEAVFTPAVSNQSFTRSAFIYSDQPLGNYLLVAKVTYSNVTPAIFANTSFVVVEGGEFVYPPAPTIPPIYIYGPSGGLVTTYPILPTEKIRASILITNYNSNISLARGITKVESVTVKNNGISNLTNVSLFIIGIPTNWFNVTPEKYLEVAPDESRIFLVEFKIPKNAKVDDYVANFIASSGVVADQKATRITIFDNIEELLKEEIRKLKKDLEDLKIDIKLAEREGKDVSTVLLITNETEIQIYGAEEDLQNNNTESAMDRVQNAINLIKKARDLLNSIEVEKAPEFMSIWMIFVLIIVIAGIVFVLVYLWKKKKMEKIRPYIVPLFRLVEIIKRKEVNVEKLEREKEKISRMLMILEREKNQGMISSSSYEKMKKSLEDKLNEIDKKIK